ncbi:MAG: TRAM domain-containing protein [Nanopusillaceae archaeon]
MVIRHIKVGDVYEVEVKNLTSRGDGFARVKGVAIFIKNVNVGWKGNIKITKVGPTYAIAEPV